MGGNGERGGPNWGDIARTEKVIAQAIPASPKPNATHASAGIHASQKRAAPSRPLSLGEETSQVRSPPHQNTKLAKKGNPLEMVVVLQFEKVLIFRCDGARKKSRRLRWSERAVPKHVIVFEHHLALRRNHCLDLRARVRPVDEFARAGHVGIAADGIEHA